MIDRRHLMQLSAASMLAPAVTGGLAHAQPWPNRVVRIVVPYSAGGPTDIVARLIADRLTQIWGRQVVIENRGGAGSNLGTEAGARSSPDGYTALISAGAIAANRSLYRTVGYDPVADFAPVTLICTFPYFMFVPNSSPAKSVAEFVAHAKQNPRKLTPSVGRCRQRAAPDGRNVPAGGRDRAGPRAVSRRLRRIERSHPRAARPLFLQRIVSRTDAGRPDPRARNQRPQTRSLGAGIAHDRRGRPPGIRCDQLVCPFCTSQDAARGRQRMHADTAAVLADRAIVTKLEQIGYTVVGSTREELATHLKSELDKWGALIKAAGISLNE
jgi:tripartite-type tricarboxylate transporter receptor subunit TctC